MSMILRRTVGSEIPDEYHLNDDRSGYGFIFDSRSENEDLIEVTTTSSGGIENIGILDWWCQLQGW